MRGQAGGRATAILQRQEAISRYYQDPNFCEQCGKRIEVMDTQKVSAIAKKRFCNRSCAAIFNNHKTPKRKAASIRSCERCKTLIPVRRKWGRSKIRFCPKCRGLSYCSDARISDKPKSSVRRQHIQRDARRVYALSNKPHKCFQCAYATHVEIAHITPVAEFSKDTLVRVINDVNNLVALCPTHHWEFDWGFLVLSVK